MIVLRQVLGEELRRRRTLQRRTLRDVSSAARVSLGYLSEVERGNKEASSELLHAICGALHVPLSEVLRSVSGEVEHLESVVAPQPQTLPADVPVLHPAPQAAGRAAA